MSDGNKRPLSTNEQHLKQLLARLFASDADRIDRHGAARLIVDLLMEQAGIDGPTAADLIVRAVARAVLAYRRRRQQRETEDEVRRATEQALRARIAELERELMMERARRLAPVPTVPPTPGRTPWSPEIVPSPYRRRRSDSFGDDWVDGFIWPHWGGHTQ